MSLVSFLAAFLVLLLEYWFISTLALEIFFEGAAGAAAFLFLPLATDSDSMVEIDLDEAGLAETTSN